MRWSPRCTKDVDGVFSGKNSGSKSSLSVDSIDSRASPQLDHHHRRSKSILKKSDSGGGHRAADPESERLISESSSLLDAGSGSDYSPKKMSSPPVAQRAHRALARNAPISYRLQQQLQEDRARTLKAPLFLLDDVAKESDKYGAGEVPLYICPPPPPMDSPTEETRLLLHANTVQRPAGNSVGKKGPHAAS